MKGARHGRRLRRRHRHSVAPPGLLNLTSMIDIFTVLLFFLLVYAAELAIFTPMSVLKLNLPAAQALTTVPETPLQIELIIRPAQIELIRNGTNYRKFPTRTDGAEFALLAQELLQLKAQSPTTREITLRPEPDVSYEVLVHVMDAARSGKPAQAAASPGLTTTTELFPDIFMGVAPPATGR